MLSDPIYESKGIAAEISAMIAGNLYDISKISNEQDIYSDLISLSQTQLHIDAFGGNSFHLRCLLEEIKAYSKAKPIMLKCLVNQGNRLGCTPLRLAASAGHLDCVNVLLEYGAVIDKVDVKQQTPFFLAIKNQKYDCAERLLQAGANPHGNPRNCYSPLYVAFMNADIRAVHLILDNGADPDVVLHAHNTYIYPPKLNAIKAAVDYMNPEDRCAAVKALLLRGCSTENFSYHPCLAHDNERLVELLFNFGFKNYDVRDIKNRTATELNLNNAAEKKLIKLKSTPRSLLSACRIVIFSCLPKPRRNLNALDSLPLPAALIFYLKFNDL